MANLLATIPLGYPGETLPQPDLEIFEGLSEDNTKELLQLANEEAEAAAGMPAIFAGCEAVRAWLADISLKKMIQTMSPKLGHKESHFQCHRLERCPQRVVEDR